VVLRRVQANAWGGLPRANREDDEDENENEHQSIVDSGSKETVKIKRLESAMARWLPIRRTKKVCVEVSNKTPRQHRGNGTALICDYHVGEKARGLRPMFPRADALPAHRRQTALLVMDVSPRSTMLTSLGRPASASHAHAGRRACHIAFRSPRALVWDFWPPGLFSQRKARTSPTPR
jgi:hypothetical protein